MGRSITITDVIHDYIARVGVREHPVLARCRRETLELGSASGMQISPEQGAVMGMLVKLMGAARTLEIGTFTGYSALSVALALPEGGHVDALDISEDYMAKARAYWREAKMDSRIAGHVAPAVHTLDKFLNDGRAATYDFAFVDADKTGYDAYYERVLQLLKKGGLVTLDNVLWSGRVADPTEKSPDTEALRAMNKKIHADERVDMVLSPIGDGLTFARKR